MIDRGYVVLESGDTYEGVWLGGEPRAGEVVFNTGHSGYEEMASDPSYFKQILVMTAPMQGNYGADERVRESSRLWIEGFVCLEMQDESRDRSWLQSLTKMGIPVVSGLDTRKLVLKLRNAGTPWGAVVTAKSKEEALKFARPLMAEAKGGEQDWVYRVSRTSLETRKGQNSKGPRVAVLDYGCKENTLRELGRRCSELGIFPSRVNAEQVRAWKPDGIMLSNGPGDPQQVQMAAETVRSLLGWRPIFGICMGHQILSLALGAKTYKLKFGHRGGNHPIRDELLKKIYVTSQNHGYAVLPESLPSDVKVTHTNLNDGTVSGVMCESKKCWGVQFHPESHPGPHDAENLFDFFVNQLS